MIRRLTLPFVVSLAVLAPGLCMAQGGGGGAVAPPPVPDSIAVIGQRRVTPATIIQTSGLVVGRALNYRDVQRAIQALYGTGQFNDVQVTQTQTATGKNVLVIQVRERPQLIKWAIRGVERLPEHAVRDKVQMTEGRPLDPAAVERARARIDSLYHARGYYLARAKPIYIYDRDSATRSACDEQCTVEWPPMHAAANSEGTEGWTVINRDDGTKQWAYKGRPLYTSRRDQQPGDTHGDGIDNTWHVAKH